MGLAFRWPADGLLALCYQTIPVTVALLVGFVVYSGARDQRILQVSGDDILVIAADPGTIRRIRKRMPDAKRTELNGLGLTILNAGPRDVASSAFLIRLRAEFPEAIIDANTSIRAASGTQVWTAARTVGWPAAASMCGAGLRVGMLDTPVESSHSTLRGQRLYQRSFLQKQVNATPSEHGTAIASILIGGGSDNTAVGLIPRASLYAASVFGRAEDGSMTGKLLAVLEALDWMIVNGVNVVNMSFETENNAVLSVVLDRAAAKGIVMTAAAGNRGPDAKPVYPAAHPKVLAVTAVDADARIYRHANRGAYIDFAAPGVGIWTAAPGRGRLRSGTSFAVPFLTAAVAFELGAGVAPDPDAIRDVLGRRALDLGKPGKDETFGRGLVQATPTCSQEFVQGN